MTQGSFASSHKTSKFQAKSSAHSQPASLTEVPGTQLRIQALSFLMGRTIPLSSIWLLVLLQNPEVDFCEPVSPVVVASVLSPSGEDSRN